MWQRCASVVLTLVVMALLCCSCTVSPGVQTMAQRIPHGRYVQILNAEHDLHLDQPEDWRQVAEAFLRELEGHE